MSKLNIVILIFGTVVLAASLIDYSKAKGGKEGTSIFELALSLAILILGVLL